MAGLVSPGCDFVLLSSPSHGRAYSVVWLLLPLSVEPCTLPLACRRELSPFGVKVAIIQPGYFQTNIGNAGRDTASARIMWNQTSLEIKEIYGREFLTACK